MRTTDTAETLHTTVSKAAFGRTPDGMPVELYTLQNKELTVRIMTLGARVTSILAPDRSGSIGDIVLGSATLADYFQGKNAYFGAIVGRYGNRIADGRFALDGHTYQVPKNQAGKNALHGGTVGFDNLVWTAKELPDGVEMSLVSPDGDQGFPGTLTTHVRYLLRGNALAIHFASTTDKPTILNLTNHSYFNLAGEGSGLITDEIITIYADHFLPTDPNAIPTGVIAPVAGTPFDLRQPTRIGDHIDDDNEQLRFAGGYDHSWVINGSPGELKPAARVEDPGSGRVLTVTTTEPAVQFYAGNSLDGTHTGPSGRPYVRRSGFCLETQHFPDSPNHANFPSTTLRPGELRRSETIFAFSTAAK